jgi:hypothetical protein
MSAVLNDCQSRSRMRVITRRLRYPALMSIAIATSLTHANPTPSASDAHAFSDLGGSGADVLLREMLADEHYTSQMRDMMRARPNGGESASPASIATRPAYRFPLSATDFAPTSQRAVPERLAATSATPEERAQLAELCRQIQQAIEASPDVRKNNLATAVTILLGSSIQVVSRRTLADAEGVNLLRAVNDAIAGAPSFKGMTQQQRTDAYDAFLVTGGLIASLHAAAQQTEAPAAVSRANDLAAIALDRFGFPVTSSSQDESISSTNSGEADRPGSPTEEAPTAGDMLDGIYSGLAIGLHISALGTVDRDVSVTYVTFYPDGKVYRRVPEGGLEGWDRSGAERESPGLWGTYTQVAPGRWQVTWNESNRVRFVEQDGQGLTYEDRSVFPVASCEGLLLEGFYLRPGALDSGYPPSWISFRRTGEFLDHELIGELAYQNLAMPDPRTIAGGQGKYRIGRNTLYLDYEGGRQVRVEIHASQEDLRISPVPALYVNGARLVNVSDVTSDPP